MFQLTRIFYHWMIYIILFCNLAKKNPGIELLSHTLLCSTIVVRPLIDRVRDGNVSFKPAIDTGKKYIRKKEEKRGEGNAANTTFVA